MRLVATKDGPGGLTVEIPGLEGKPWGYVVGTRLGKCHVSFYLTPMYAFRDLDDALSPELRRRKHGKSCFNFTTVIVPAPHALRYLPLVPREHVSSAVN